MTRARTPLVVAALAGLLASSPALAVDPPHDGTCSNCHSLHGASYPNLLGQLCEGCHFEGGPAPAVQTHSSRTTDTDYGNWDLDCWACHNPHTQEQDDAYGTSYGKYVRKDLDAVVKEIDTGDPGPYYEAVSTIRTVTSSNVRFTSDTGFVDGDGQADDDICQVCHEQTAYYNTGSELNYHTDYGPDSQPGGTCTNCHQHEDGFSPSGGACTSCHASAQPSAGYRRQVVSSGGDFERTSHHVTDGTTTEIVTADDCRVCHDQSWHQANTDPEVYLNDPDGGASIGYDGTGASIEQFCVNCHDADGPTAFDTNGDPSDGYQPFSDGQDPPDIATDWASAAHNASTPAALGDEACLACHGGSDSTRTGVSFDRNVHGSDLDALLSPTIAGATVSNAEEEVCFACHDGAVASTDIWSEFAKGTNGTYVYHHPVDDSEQSAGRSVECTDCHDPHAARSGDALAGVSGIDIDGNAVSEVSAQYELCFRCHGDDYNTSRSRTTNKRTDFDPNNSAFHPVVAAGRNTSSTLDTSLLGGLTTSSTIECTDCHNNEQTADALGAASNSSSGPQGPHGSTNPYLLRGYYWTSTSYPGSYSRSNFELCFLCHDPTMQVETERYSAGARTNFMKTDKGSDGKSYHYLHVYKIKAPCVACHYNAHSNENESNTWYLVDGTLYTAPPSGYKTRLVAFAPGMVTGGGGYSTPTWGYDTSTRQRSCYVTCHGKSHNPKSYTPPFGDDDPLTIP